ncbi:diaminopimelate epimerase [Enterococcus sp. JM4C]|uniref:diaminopimelate epimerase n=1 Tax=Candidatus Enterococcus huntleyi TaxID=1857217 RepID=UPI001379AE80|nr:diaminopimelate epimerase [Enterococcus sp. JM4C]KAF1297252.1 diaminopimelate epimerase [Enterococcus sp. JM4C]
MKIQKVHGSENDFFLLDQMEDVEVKLSAAEIDKLRASICSRESGLLGGADGLLVVEESEQNAAIGKMRVINSDGSEASMCGNGLRTVARYLAEKNKQDSFKVETMFADLKVRKTSELDTNVKTYQVEISPVSLDPQTIPVRAEEAIINQILPELSSTIHFSAVAVPNPHLIAFVAHDLLISEEFERIARLVNEENQLFPDGVNVSFVEILDKNELFVRTFERGVGFTSACGTAMCASSLMYDLLHGGEFYETITVRNVGGLVKTVVHEEEGTYWMELIGNATVTHDIEGELDVFLARRFSDLVIRETQEQLAYQNMINRMVR